MFFDIHQDGECHFFFFFFFFFAFRFLIFEFEYRKAKNRNQTKLLLICTYFEQENTLLIGKVTVFSKFTRCG